MRERKREDGGRQRRDEDGSVEEENHKFPLADLE